MGETSMWWYGKKSEGAPGDAGGYDDERLTAMMWALYRHRNGVLRGCQVTATAPPTKSVDVAVGEAIVQGKMYFLEETEENAGINDNSSGNPRKDMVVLRVDWPAQTIRVAVLEGTPAATPTLPTPTQIDGTLWEQPLAVVDVADGFAAILDDDIEDWRIVITTGDDPGDLKAHAGETLPEGWLPPDGREVSRTRYADLFAAIGTLHGAGDGSTTFNLPDLRGRVLLALDDMGTAAGAANVVTATEADSVGGTAGSETITLTVDQLPSHTHSLPTNTWATGASPLVSSGSDLSITLYSITGAAGSDEAHDNMPPYMTVNVGIKT